MSRIETLKKINPDSIRIDEQFIEFISTLKFDQLLEMSKTFDCKKHGMEIDDHIDRREHGYNGNNRVKKHGVQQVWNFHNLIEYKLCSMSAQYFARNYCKIYSLDDGLVDFNLYDYQDKMFDHFDKNRFSIVLACRQSGKSISSVIYLLHSALFGSEKIAILANKGATAREMLARITLALENIPFFLQTGVKTLNKGNIIFSNLSEMTAASTSSSSIRGLSISLLFLDEFAFIDNDAEFYTATYPVITSGKNTKIIITSTANGMGNTFYNIWKKSQEVESAESFQSFRVDWWDVPGRDEAWKKLTIENTSELQFAQEFGNEFLGSSGTLINGETLLGMNHRDPLEHKDNILIYKYPEEKRQYLSFVDVGKGLGQDSSTINIIDVTKLPYEQVAVYRSNKISHLVFPTYVYNLSKKYNNAYCVIENNFGGVADAMWYDFEYENMYTSSAIKSTGIGCEMTKKVKRIGCANIKNLLESGKLILHDLQTIIEFTTFVEDGKSYAADKGEHDDLVMNFVMFGWFTATINWMEYSTDTIREMIANEKEAEIEAQITPIGYLGDESIDPDVPVNNKSKNDNWSQTW